MSRIRWWWRGLSIGCHISWLITSFYPRDQPQIYSQCIIEGDRNYWPPDTWWSCIFSRNNLKLWLESTFHFSLIVVLIPSGKVVKFLKVHFIVLFEHFQTFQWFSKIKIKYQFNENVSDTILCQRDDKVFIIRGNVLLFLFLPFQMMNIGLNSAPNGKSKTMNLRSKYNFNIIQMVKSSTYILQ